jgi:hypothetical protein
MATCLAACAHWQVQSGSPQQVIETRQPKKIRVTRTDRTEVVVDQPRIVSDTLYGSRAGSPRAADPATDEGIALADVSRVAIRRTDVAATTLLVLGSTVVIGGVAADIIVHSIPD